MDFKRVHQAIRTIQLQEIENWQSCTRHCWRAWLDYLDGDDWLIDGNNQSTDEGEWIHRRTKKEEDISIAFHLRSHQDIIVDQWWVGTAPTIIIIIRVGTIGRIHIQINISISIIHPVEKTIQSVYCSTDKARKQNKRGWARIGTKVASHQRLSFLSNNHHAPSCSMTWLILAWSLASCLMASCCCCSWSFKEDFQSSHIVSGGSMERTERSSSSFSTWSQKRRPAGNSTSSTGSSSAPTSTSLSISVATKAVLQKNLSRRFEWRCFFMFVQLLLFLDGRGSQR